jgi:hypothetical protein
MRALRCKQYTVAVEHAARQRALLPRGSAGAPVRGAQVARGRVPLEEPS